MKEFRYIEQTRNIRARFLIHTGAFALGVGIGVSQLLPLEVCAESDSAAGICLTQNMTELGNVKVSATKSALRIDFIEKKCTLVSAAPDWKVCLFRPLEKTVWIGDARDVTHYNFTSLVQLGRSAVGPDAKRRADGWRIWSIDGLLKDKGAFLVGKHEFKGVPVEVIDSIKVAYKSKVIVTCLEPSPVASQAAAIVSQLASLKGLDKMPLEVRRTALTNPHLYRSEHDRDKELAFSVGNLTREIDTRSGPQLTLTSSNIEKSQLNASIFLPPRNYKSVKSPVEILYSAKVRDVDKYSLLLDKDPPPPPK